MSANFKKSLFGFNQNDVIEYIKASSLEAKTKENELNSALSEATKQNELLEKTNTLLGEKLAFFEEKYDELNELCENISRVYLTTKASSKAIMESTEENCRVMQNQVDLNINTLNEVQAVLDKLKEQVSSTAGLYNKEVSNVQECLSTAKDVISANKTKSAEALDNFNNAVK